MSGDGAQKAAGPGGRGGAHRRGSNTARALSGSTAHLGTVADRGRDRSVYDDRFAGSECPVRGGTGGTAWRGFGAADRIEGADSERSAVAEFFPVRHSGRPVLISAAADWRRW